MFQGSKIFEGGREVGRRRRGFRPEIVEPQTVKRFKGREVLQGRASSGKMGLGEGGFKTFKNLETFKRFCEDRVKPPKISIP